MEATAEAEAWAEQRKRARRKRQSVLLVSKAMGVTDTTKTDSAKVPKVGVTVETQEAVDLVLGAHWEATHEIVKETLRGGRQWVDAAAAKRAAATTQRLDQLAAEVQSKLKLRTLEKVLQEVPLEEILADVEGHINEVNAVVRKDHEDWLISHVEFMDDFSKNHTGSLHELLTQVAGNREELMAARHARIEAQKEARSDMAAQVLTEQLKAELRGELESQLWRQKTAMEKRMLRLQAEMEKERVKAEATEMTVQALRRAADSQLQTMQLAVDQLQKDSLAVEQELAEARKTIVGLEQERQRQNRNQTRDEQETAGQAPNQVLEEAEGQQLILPANENEVERYGSLTQFVVAATVHHLWPLCERHQLRRCIHTTLTTPVDIRMVMQSTTGDKSAAGRRHKSLHPVVSRQSTGKGAWNPRTCTAKEEEPEAAICAYAVQCHDCIR